MKSALSAFRDLVRGVNAIVIKQQAMPIVNVTDDRRHRVAVRPSCRARQFPFHPWILAIPLMEYRGLGSFTWLKLVVTLRHALRLLI